jgi:hypothetical protein
MLSQLFDGANLFVLPFWTLIIFLPKWDVTRKLISSPLPYITLAELSENWVKTPHFRAAFWAQTQLRRMRSKTVLVF